MKLSLKAGAGNWEKFLQRREKKLFQKIRKEVMIANKYTCQFCYFRSPDLDVINLDNDYSHNAKSNLVGACELCAKCTLLDSYQLDYDGEDKIIYLPELTQEQLNQLIRILFCQTKSGDPDAGYNAKMMTAQLQDRAGWLDEKTGCKMSHPAMFVHYMGNKTHDTKLVGKLRWLPDISSFAEKIPQWQQLIHDAVE